MILKPERISDLLVEAQALAKFTLSFISLSPKSFVMTSVLLVVFRFKARSDVPLVGLVEDKKSYSSSQ